MWHGCFQGPGEAPGDLEVPPSRMWGQQLRLDLRPAESDPRGTPHSHCCDNLVVRYPGTSTSSVFLGKMKPGSQPLTWEGWG